jgi:hypothetical protein
MLGRRLTSSLRTLVSGALIGVVSLIGACNLNPQPEVPSGATGGKGGIGGAGTGGSGGLGMGGSAAGGAGGVSSGGVGGSGGGVCDPSCGSGSLCYGGQCVGDPCASNSCASDQACKPNQTFDAASCVPSCAGVTCAAGETCQDGTCVPTGCPSDCSNGEICLPDGDGGYSCQPDPCSSGVNCNQSNVCAPTTGTCVPDPCVGVKCPVGQTCNLGECRLDDDAGTGDAALD